MEVTINHRNPRELLREPDNSLYENRRSERGSVTSKFLIATALVGAFSVYMDYKHPATMNRYVHRASRAVSQFFGNSSKSIFGDNDDSCEPNGGVTQEIVTAQKKIDDRTNRDINKEIADKQTDAYRVISLQIGSILAKISDAQREDAKELSALAKEDPSRLTLLANWTERDQKALAVYEAILLGQREGVSSSTPDQDKLLSDGINMIKAASGYQSTKAPTFGIYGVTDAGFFETLLPSSRDSCTSVLTGLRFEEIDAHQRERLALSIIDQGEVKATTAIEFLSVGVESAIQNMKRNTASLSSSPETGFIASTSLSKFIRNHSAVVKDGLGKSSRSKQRGKLEHKLMTPGDMCVAVTIESSKGPECTGVSVSPKNAGKLDTSPDVTTLPKIPGAIPETR